MELLNNDEIYRIIKPLGFSKVLKWSIKEYSDEIVGYLGEHLTLVVDVEIKTLKFFVKCMPRWDKLKAEYLKELTFFKKEYMMMSKLFRNFKQGK
jgi:hypothetical protein